MDTIKLQPLSAAANASVMIPGSKSYTNRAYIMAALTDGDVRIQHPLESDDTVAMAACLSKLGIQSSRDGESIVVHGGLSQVGESEYDLDANLSGTTIRFLTALSCVIPGTKTLYGKDGLNKRPIRELVDGLRQLGAEIEYLEREGFPPIRIMSAALHSGVARVNGDVSSQYFSALLMVAPQVGDITIEVVGEQISKLYIDMTIDMMRQWGVEAQNGNYRRYRVRGGQQYRQDAYTVEADVSSASYFAAIAALTKSRITLANANPNSKQADMAFLKILGQMGNKVIRGTSSITVQGSGVRSIEVDMEQCPDQAQTLAVLAAFASGTTHITGIRSLRVKETERVVALERELAKMGIRTESTNDSLTIHGGDPKAARIDTYGDHRMAMSFAVAGSLLPGMEINDPDVVQKTFPTFWDVLKNVGVGVSYI